MREGARGLVGEEAGRATPEGDLAQLQHYSCSGSNSELREPRTLRLIKPQLQTAGFKGGPPGLLWYSGYPRGRSESLGTDVIKAALSLKIVQLPGVLQAAHLEVGRT